MAEGTHRRQGSSGDLSIRLHEAREQSAQARPEGGSRVRNRSLRTQGRATLSKLLDAGMIELDRRGLNGIRVDDVVKRAGVSHGSFYQYFLNKEDLFRSLLRDALDDMLNLADDFPVITRDEAGKTRLRSWVRRFFKVYAAHRAVFRIVVSTDILVDEFYSEAIQTLFAVAEAIISGMTAADRTAGKGQEGAELKAVACLMMLEGVNLLMSNEVSLPEEEMSDRIARIIFDVFVPDA